MYVRDAKKREEVWLLDRFEEFGFEDPAFRSRDYVFAVDEDTGEKAGFGRLRIHTEGGESVCEITNIGVLDEWRGQGVGAHVVEALVDDAEEEGLDVVYSLTEEPDYLEQFGFERVDEADLPEKLRDRLDEERAIADGGVTPVRVAVDEFAIPRDLRGRFEGEDEGEQETAEDFGIDAESATYKYDTGR
ncbi:GNAT family N-acetyltransferase [Halospeciosus flavus]|uniref:GNAT family N-acetyltransferase n=1 Tax=Halospeciosus flavus TaxID=3032283 RepID=A0ABD5Z4A9_9EURY|nr:GNAT family N-acetyltransferase [Halospeciosus flavus]